MSWFRQLKVDVLLIPHIMHDDLLLTMFTIVVAAKPGSVLRLLAKSTVWPWLIPQSSGEHIKGRCWNFLQANISASPWWHDVCKTWLSRYGYLLSQGQFVDAVAEKHAVDTQWAALNIPEQSLEQQRPEDDPTRRLCQPTYRTQAKSQMPAIN